MTTTPARPRPVRGPREERGPAPSVRWSGPAWLDGPMTSCHLVLGAAGLLLLIGLVMVFSASSIEAALADEPAWAPGVQQLDLGRPRASARCWSRCGCRSGCSGAGRRSRWSSSPSCCCWCWCPASACKLNGARQWFDLGFALLAALGARQARLRALGRARPGPARALPDDDVAARPGAAGVRRPLAAADRRAGLRRRSSASGWCWSGCSGPAGCRCAGSAGSSPAAPAVLALVVTFCAVPAWTRITSFLDPFADPTDGGFQAIRGMYALATGGLWGVGLGNSAMKWNLLPRGGVRLHLRDHRRGARLPRLPGGRHPLRRAGLRRLPDRPPRRPTGSSSWPASRSPSGWSARPP